MSGFGAFLQHQGILSQDHLDQALQSKAVYGGGRLGTNLIECGVFSLEALSAYLSDHHSVPLPAAERTEHPDVRALKLIPMPLLRRCKMLPMRVDKNDIHVAMLDTLGRADVHEVLIHPIEISGRVVNVLYSDSGDDTFAETSIAALTAVCDCISRAYENALSRARSVSADVPASNPSTDDLLRRFAAAAWISAFSSCALRV